MRILSNGNDGILVGGLSEDGETAWTDVISSAEVDHQYYSLELSRSDDALVTCGYDGARAANGLILS